MDFRILTDDDATVGRMTFDPAGDIMNNVYLSLVVKRGSWFQNPEFGSRLHLLQRAKNTAKTAALAEEYCREALRWLIDCDRATKVDVRTERDRSQDLHRLKLLVEVTQADGRQVSFERFVEVV
ncbi:MAG: Phage protein GP46 [Syntrophorhabdus sp. PtaB.Bin047]|jgi:phage gp46-like protein|nr:MAG: Phage protein GP46 [Syntrophorhabdus sp. PtaB.Bin047]